MIFFWVPCLRTSPKSWIEADVFQPNGGLGSWNQAGTPGQPPSRGCLSKGGRPKKNDRGITWYNQNLTQNGSRTKTM